MPRKAVGLTAVKVRTARRGRYGDGKGLYLLVRSADARFWLFRYRREGRMREMGLGSVVEVSLAEARGKAEKLHRMVREGIDPLAEREARVAAQRVAAHQIVVRAITFADVANNYIAAHELSWRNLKHRQQWRNTLDTYAIPILGALPVAEVDTGAVLRVLEPVWRQKTETASRLRGRIESVLDYASARGWRSGENPARWRGHLDNLLPARGKIAKVEHHAALPWREIGGLMMDLAKQPGVAALALRFTILTAARTGEAIGAIWREIDMAGAVWTVPAGRTKAAREHRVPLSDAALNVLRQAARLSQTEGLDAPVFAGGKPGKGLSNMALLALLRRMGRGALTTHGFRSTFRDWAGEATAHKREVVELAMAHRIGDAAEQAYARGDLFMKRRKLMSDWAAYCAKQEAAGEVGPLFAAT